MAKTWYPTNFYGFYVNGNSNYKLTGIAIHYKDSFIHSGHFYSASSSPLLLRGAPDYSKDTVSEFHVEAHRQLQVKDLPKVPTWRLERGRTPNPPVESHRINQYATTSYKEVSLR